MRRLIREVRLKVTVSDQRETLERIAKAEPRFKLSSGGTCSLTISSPDPTEILEHARRIAELVKEAGQAPKDFK